MQVQEGSTEENAVMAEAGDGGRPPSPGLVDDDAEEEMPVGADREETIPQEEEPDDDDDGNEEMTIKYRRKDLLAIMLALKVVHHQSDKAFADYMRIMNYGSDVQEKELPDSTYLYKKAVQEVLPCVWTYVLYCDECNVTLGESSSRFKVGRCRLCDKDLKEDLKAGRCMFVKFPLREQIESYAKGGTLTRLMEKYEPHYRRIMRGRRMYERHLRGGNWTTSLFCDTANLTRRYGVKFHPALLFFNNIPVASQIRFPVIAGLFCSNAKRFPSELIVQHVQEELREFRENPVEWKKRDGSVMSSHVFLTMCITDAPEKREFLRQVGHGGFWSCPYCYDVGDRITRENYPHVWRRDMLCFKRTSDTEDGRAVVGVRFPRLVHHERGRIPLRGDGERLAQGRRALRFNELHTTIRGRHWRSRLLSVRNCCTTFITCFGV